LVLKKFMGLSNSPNNRKKCPSHSAFAEPVRMLRHYLPMYSSLL